MKKLLSILVLTAMLLSVMTMAVSANNSPVGKVTIKDTFYYEDAPEANGIIVNEKGEEIKVDLTKFEYTDKNGEKKVANIIEKIIINVIEIKILSAEGKTLAILPLAAKDNSWTAAKNVVAGLGDKYADYKVYSAFEVSLNDEAKAILGKNVIKAANIELNVPGLNGATSPVVFNFDDDANKYSVIEKAAINGSNVKMAIEFDPQHTAYYGVLCTAAETAPATGVNPYITVALATLFVVALAGVAFAGKKAFAKN